LLLAAQLGCIELNPFNSRVKKLENPDYAIIDLDPEDISFDYVIKAAQEVHHVLTEIGAEHVCKTSGATGLHIYIPLGAKYTHEQAKQFCQLVCALVHQRIPKFTSLERKPAKRKKKVYLDCLQNNRGQTLASVYSLRPKPKAPVSTPLKWSEVKKGLNPSKFNMKTIFARIKKEGDLFKPVLGKGINMEKCLKKLEKISG
jgi:bifunctional non-homologous end joining protein LigD